MSRRNHQFSSVRTEGGLLPQDVLSRIQAGDKNLPGLMPDTYHLGPHERIGEAVNRAWSRLIGAWRAFQEALGKVPDAALATGLTRDRWLLPLFQELGYGRLPKAQTIETEGKSFAVSHLWHHSPIHLLGVGVDLDRRQAGVVGAAKASPHGLVQDFLNRSQHHLWGFVSNGLHLRVLRDHHSLTRQAYVEFDLQAIMEGEQYSEFLLLWMVCHQSRVEADKPEDCWLELWFNTSRDEGVRALDKLRGGVEKAIEAFGTGFLANRANTKLLQALESGELDKQEYYRQILRLVYRLIFLFVAEERDALLAPDADDSAKSRYLRFYATRRLRELADKRRGGPHGDLWRGLRLVMSKLDDGCPELALPALGSRLWGPTACPWLMEAECGNEHLLDAFRQMSNIEEGRTRYAVNWRNVGADELGSIYEGLLELHPRMNKEAGTFALETAAGHERKTTGSYYTPTVLVDCLLNSALDPVLDEASKKPNTEAAILDLKVCDPACGSGHFLVAAARRIAKRLAAVRAGEDEPSPREVQRALRDVVGRCIYGVDVNPMAVELCKVSLWMEAIEPGRPLSFLDSHIQCGNALLGATPALMARGIPDEAFKAIEGDEPRMASALKKRNRLERLGSRQATLYEAFDKADEADDDLVSIVGRAWAVEEAPDDEIGALRAKEARWDEFRRSVEFREGCFRADTWCAAFVWPKHSAELVTAAVTEELWRRLQRDASTVSGLTRQTVRELARSYRFFHWHLAFAQVFGELRGDFDERESAGWTGGFDVVLGNPPWERIKIQEKEFFSARAPDIAAAVNAAARKEAIARLEAQQPGLWADWQNALRQADGESNFVRDSGRYPLCGRGDVNTYSIFSEMNRGLLSPKGRAGFIVPSGIATDATTQHFFRSLVEQGQLTSLYSFWEIRRVFPDTDSRSSFALVSLAGTHHPGLAAEFAFDLRDVKELADSTRRFSLSAADISLLNPNTGTCPVFRSRRDAEITKAVYRRVPVLVREGSEERPEENPWGVSFRAMLHMANDSGLFRTREELAAAGWRLCGNVFERDGERLLPLLEAKMIHHFDHRFGDYADKPPESQSTALPTVPSPRLADPTYSITPRYWVPESEVDSRLAGRWEHGWLFGWRDICRSTDMRTVIASVVPRVAVGHTTPLMMPTMVAPTPWACCSANLASFIFDYLARQKIGGTHLTYSYLKQLPVLPPATYAGPAPWQPDSELAAWIGLRVLELSFTAWDLAAFALDLGWNGPPFRWDEERRFVLRAELDAAFFHLYGIARDDVAYIMETFPIVRRNDEKEHGSFRTRDAILTCYDQMQHAIETGMPYETVLDPLPADPRLAHPESTCPAWIPMPKPRQIEVPAMPATIPTLNPAEEAALCLWALLHANGGSIPRTQLARAFALQIRPALLERLAPADLAAKAGNWAQRVAHRNVAPGTLTDALRTLADRDGIRLTTDAASRSVVTTTPHTPPENQLHPWFRFEARLALSVLAALPPEPIQDVDATMSEVDRALLQEGSA